MRRAAALRRAQPPAVWAGLSGPWKITAGLLKGTDTIPARSFCAGHSVNGIVKAGLHFIFLEELKFGSKSVPRAALVIIRQMMSK